MAAKLAIVPAYNEEESVARVVAELHAHAPDFDVLVVSDGSTDATVARARAAGAEVLVLPFNLGIGGAVQAGYVYAVENGYGVAVQVDGDGQHDPRSLRVLEDYLDQHPEIDMVVGSRFLAEWSEGYASTRSRRVGIALFARILSAIVGRSVTDPTSGLRMTNRRGTELFARDYPHDYPEVEAILMVHAHRLRSAEVPVVMRERAAGSSSINRSRSAYYMIKVLLALFVGLFRARPVVEPGDRAPVVAERSL
jgi:glycosyltransferase involved in cell wall biosynthesis